MTNFNYNNRKSVGSRLGAIVAKDLRKRIKPSPQKGSASAPLEISLENKELNDGAIKEISGALVEALSPADGYTKTRLSALILRDNAITAKALKYLAPAVTAACTDLIVIDLKSNWITIADDEDACSLETFLKSLSQCHHLVKLDLGKNNMDDCRVFEIFSRVYLKQFKTAVVTWLDNLCGGGRLSLVNGEYRITKDSSTSGTNLVHALRTLSLRDTNKQAPAECDLKEREMEPSNFVRRPVAGLPTVAFINFGGCFVGDAGALWLSWVVQRHRWFQESILQHKWNEPNEDGATIEILPNDSMSESARKMLKLAENTRYQTATLTGIEEYLKHPVFDSNLFEELDQPDTGLRRTLLGAARIQRRVSDPPSPDQSRMACPSGTGTEGLDWHRTRIQRLVLEKFGIREAELWRAAIKLVCYVRQSVAIRQRSAQKDKQSAFFDEEPASVNLPIARDASKRPVSKAFEHVRTYAASLQHSRDDVDAPTRSHAHRPTAVFTAPGARNRAQCKHVAGTRADADELQSTTAKLQLPQPQSEKMVGRVPQHVFLRIASSAADADGLLSEQQTANVIAYAQDRTTLRAEMERLGKSDSHQMWCVLEKVNSLMYEDELERPNSISEDL